MSSSVFQPRSLPGAQEVSGQSPPADHIGALPPAAQGVVSRTLGRDDRSYHALASNGALSFENRWHALQARFGVLGLEIRAGGGQLGLSLRASGYGEDL